jgi:hypothetical protein
MDATITSFDTNQSDHRALNIINKPNIGDTPSHQTASTPSIPTTRNHLSFLLPISKPLIDLYQLGNATTQEARRSASNYITEITTSIKTPPTHIDKAAKRVITMLNAYHELAQTIWPMAQPYTQTESSKMQTPLH